MTLLHKGSKEGEHGTKMTEASSRALTAGPSAGHAASATVSPLSPPHPSSSPPSTTSSKSPDHIPHKRSNTYTFGRNLPFVPSVVTAKKQGEGSSSSVSHHMKAMSSSSSNSMDRSCSVDEVKKLIYEKSPSKVDCRVMDGEVVSFQDALHVAKLSKQVKKETTRSHVMES